MQTQKQETKIRNVTIPMPEPLDNFFRTQAKRQNQDYVELLVYSLVDLARSQIEDMDHGLITDLFGLKEVFKEILE